MAQPETQTPLAQQEIQSTTETVGSGDSNNSPELTLASQMEATDDPFEAFRAASSFGNGEEQSSSNSVEAAAEDFFAQANVEQGFTQPPVEASVAEASEADVMGNFFAAAGGEVSPPPTELPALEESDLIPGLNQTEQETAEPTDEVLNEADFIPGIAEAFDEIASETSEDSSPEADLMPSFEASDESSENTESNDSLENVGNREPVAVVNRESLTPLESGETIEESPAENYMRIESLKNLVSADLVGDVLRGSVKISQAHGGYRLSGERFANGYDQTVYSKNELITFGVWDADQSRLTDSEASAAQAGAAVELEVPPVEVMSDEDIEGTVELSSYESLIISGDLQVEQTDNGDYMLSGDQAPDGLVFSPLQAEYAGLLAAQESVSRSQALGREINEDQEDMMLTLRGSVSSGLVGRIARGEAKLRQRHGGYSVEDESFSGGESGVYTKSELKSLGVFQTGEVIRTSEQSAAVSGGEAADGSLSEEDLIPGFEEAANESEESSLEVEDNSVSEEVASESTEKGEKKAKASAENAGEIEDNTAEQHETQERQSSLAEQVKDAENLSQEEQMKLMQQLLTEMMTMAMTPESGEGSAERQVKVGQMIELFMNLFALMMTGSRESGVEAAVVDEHDMEADADGGGESEAAATTAEVSAQTIENESQPEQQTRPTSQPTARPAQQTTSANTVAQPVQSSPISNRPATRTRNLSRSGSSRRPLRRKPPVTTNTAETPVGMSGYMDSEGNMTVIGEPGTPSAESDQAAPTNNFQNLEAVAPGVYMNAEGEAIVAGEAGSPQAEAVDPYAGLEAVAPGVYVDSDGEAKVAGDPGTPQG